MADHHHHHHHHHHRPHRLSLPSRPPIPTTTTTTTTPTPQSTTPTSQSTTPTSQSTTLYTPIQRTTSTTQSTTPTTQRTNLYTTTPQAQSTTPKAQITPHYPTYPYPTPTPTPSKHRLSTTTTTTTTTLLLLFSLRSLYSLLPFLQASPSSFSIFPFSFLVSLLSFFLTFFFTIFTAPSNSSKDRFFKRLQQPIFSISSISVKILKVLLIKSIILAIVFLLRFQALRYCGTSAMILAELSGNVAAKFVTLGRKRDFEGFSKIGFGKIRGFLGLFIGLFMLSVSWDRAECFPFSSINVRRFGLSVFPGGENCVRVWPMLLPFMAGFLGSYERVFMNQGSVRELGRKRVRLVTLFFTTVVLFVPAVVSMFVFEVEGDSISVTSLGWPLANTVVFGVLLSENLADERSDSKDFQREYVVTFLCTLVLELFYFPELSLWGLLIAGLLLWIAVRELDPLYSDYVQLGLESSESVIMKPLRHILSERKSRKIALFLLINTAYMVVEFAAGFMSNSLGLISDACHMLFDCAALAIGLYASYISRLPANSQFNYGRGRFEVLSGYVNAVFLVLVGALIVLESMERILDPQEISTNSLLSVSVGGFLVNLVGLIFFHEEHHHAHGGPGSCSHSHSDSHSNHDHHHHADVNKNNESVTISYANDGKPSSSHDQQYSGGDNVHHDTCEGHKSGNEGGCNHNSGHHNHSHHDDHHDHHDHRHHDHDNGHQHDHQNHSHQDDHHHHDHLHHHDVVHRGQDGNSEKSYMQTPGVSLEIHKGHVRHEFGNDHSEQVINGRKPLEQGHHHHHHIDHNMEGIFLHVLADTLGSVGVVISTLLIKYKGWLVADPACSIFISILIVSSVIPLLRNSAGVLLQRVPRAHEHDLRDALKNIMKLKGVCGIQNFHVWSLTNTDVVGTLHLHLSAETDKDFVKTQVSHLLTGAGINDLTIHVEHILSS